MKKKIGLIALLLANNAVFAVNPVQGLYGGIILGINYTPNTNYVFPANVAPADIQLSQPGVSPVTTLTIPSPSLTLKYSTMGQIGGQLGYRCGKYRGEGQFVFNNSPYSSIQSGNLQVSSNHSSSYTFVGSTNTVYGMLNGFYDFLPSDPNSNFAPYVGVGIGYAAVQNTLNLGLWSVQTGTNVRNINITETTYSMAGQAIIGASYFLDDFTAFGLDLRYLTTSAKSNILDARLQVLTLNVTFNGAFNLG